MKITVFNLLVALFFISDIYAQKLTPISEPLVTDQYTADPSAHVFNGKIYIYPSHDIDAGIPEDDMGSHFGMRDYHVFSQEKPTGTTKDEGIILKLEDIPWADKMLWAPDAMENKGKYYLYFPAKDKEGIFRIGVAQSKSPTGPFKAEKNYMKGSFSIDPSVFKDDDGSVYLYFGGIWGGQLQRWKTGEYAMDDSQPADNQPALMPKMGKLKGNMVDLAEPVRDIQIIDKEGKLLLSSDHERRFFEAPWVHKYQGKYYLSYSTGDTHNIAYAIGDNPYGPFTYQGIVLYPVQGWTNHHSIIEFEGNWYLYYHDTQMSNKTHLRNIKMAPLNYREDGSIIPIKPYK